MAQRDHGHMRQRLAQQAAQILLDSGRRDFQAAKKKAAQRLGATDTKSLPSNQEIETALIEYQRLFRADKQSEQLKYLRKIAIEAMRFLSDFNPRLVEGVLDGTADENSWIRLHIFADTVENVGFYLLDNQIPYGLSERCLKIGMEQYAFYSVYEFMVDGVSIELVVFQSKQRQSPLSPIDNKPVKRANLAEVEELLRKSE